MDVQSLKEGGWISRFLHIVFLAAIVAPGVYFGSHRLVAAVTAVWFVLFSAVYLLAGPQRSASVQNHTSGRGR